MLLVGCGKMGGAMLRGWLARGAAPRGCRGRAGRRRRPISPASQSVAWHRAADDLPAVLSPDAVVLRSSRR